MDDIGTGPAPDMPLRISAAVLMRLCVECPSSAETMLVLERAASRRRLPEGERIDVKAKPVGGGMRILDVPALHERIGPFRFDSPRSREEADFRIFIPPERQAAVVELCLEQFRGAEAPIIDALPERELVEEMHDSLSVHVTLAQFDLRPLTAVVEAHPVPSSSPRARDVLTQHIYAVYLVRVTDPTLAQALLDNSAASSDDDLRRRAQEDVRRGGWGRANAVLALPFDALSSVYASLAPEERARDQRLFDHTLTGSVRHLLDAPAAYDLAFPL